MSNEIVIQDRPVALMARESTKEIQEIGRKLMKLTPGGKKLDPEQCAELAVASFITGANPFANEIYYMPTVGPYLGYQFYNRKANEQLAAEDPRTPPRIWFDEKPADHTDAQFSDDDIAWTVTLHDSVTHATWLGQQMEMFIKLTTAGLPAEQAWKIAESKAGPEPIWKASAVVYSDEEFSKEKWEKDKNGVAHPTGEMKPEKWDRNERCKKRAQKWALRKRFSNMVIPDPELGDDIIDAGTREIIDQVTSEIKRDEQNKPVHTVEQNLLELGFNSDPIPSEHDSSPPIEQVQEQPKKQKSNGFNPIEALIEWGYAQDTFHAQGMLNKSPFIKAGVKMESDALKTWAKAYRGWRDSGKEANEAAQLATDGKTPA